MAGPTRGGALPPISWDIVEEHLDEAAFLHPQWERALSDAEYVLEDVRAGPERRMLYHLDGLVVDGRRVAQKVLAPALASDDVDRIFAATYALLASEDGDFIAPVLAALAKAEPEPAAAIGRALEVVPRDDLLPRLAPVLAAVKATPAASAAVLGVLAHRRLDCRAPLDAFQASPDLGVRVAALKLARVFPRAAHPALLERALLSKETAERDAALATGLVVGVRPAWPACLKALGDGGESWAFPALLHGLSGEADLSLLTGALADPERRRAALFALGFTGRVAAADAVLTWLGDKKDGAVAGEAFSAITGLALAGKFAKPPKRWNPEAPEEEDGETGPEADLPIPDPEQVARWWARARKQLDPAKRLLGGQPWSGDALLAALERGPMRRREALALDLAIRTQGQAQVPCDATAARQSRILATLRAARIRLRTGPYGTIPGSSSPPSATPLLEGALSRVVPAVPRAGELVVTGAAVVTSVGQTPAACAAAVLASIARPVPLPDVQVVDLEEHASVPATGHAVTVAEGFTGVGRLAILGAAAMARVRDVAPPPARVGMYLCLPSYRILDEADRIAAEEPSDPADGSIAAAKLERVEARLVQAILRDAGLPRAPDHVELFPGDGPGFVAALRVARAGLDDGEDQAIVGGIDSLVDAEVAEALLRLRLLKTPELPTGTTPGEAAAFLVLEKPDVARRRRATVLGCITADALELESPGVPGAMPSGRALARALEAARGAAGSASPPLLLADLNGTTARASDWGGALVRLRGALGEPQVLLLAPSLGDVGAAFGPLAISIALAALERPGACAEWALAWTSDAGARASVAVRRAASPEPRPAAPARPLPPDAR